MKKDELSNLEDKLYNLFSPKFNSKVKKMLLQREVHNNIINMKI